MKTLALIILSAMALPGVYGQAKDTCRPLEFKEANIFIPNAVDTTQENGLKVKLINAANLVSGFELISSDRSVEILSFRLVFDNRFDGNLYTISSKGNKIGGDQQQTFLLSKIAGATLLTIDDLIFRYNNVCYKGNGQVYLCR